MDGIMDFLKFFAPVPSFIGQKTGEFVKNNPDEVKTFLKVTNPIGSIFAEKAAQKAKENPEETKHLMNFFIPGTLLLDECMKK